MDDIGSIIRFHRKKAGLTQIHLARLAGVGKATIFDIEKGKRTVQWESLSRVFAALNISVSFHSPLMEEYSAAESRRSSDEHRRNSAGVGELGREGT